MPFVYLTSQGAEVRRQGDNLVVRHEGRCLARLHVHQVDALWLFGRVHLTLPAMELLLGRGVDTTFLTASGRVKGHLRPALSRRVDLRLAQYRGQADPACRLDWAREFVCGKLRNAAGMVRRFAGNHPGLGLGSSAACLEEYASQARSADSLANLRGIEGAGTRAYFDVLARMCLGDLVFNGRSSRPPRDPFNALMSLGYVLLGNELAALLEAAGLDPDLGFYHQPVGGRAALALDLIEEFRHPLIDRFCLTLNNRRMFGPDDFLAGPDGGVRLAPESLKRFLARYDRWMRGSPRRALRTQVEGVVASLKRGRPYEPFVLER